MMFFKKISRNINKQCLLDTPTQKPKRNAKADEQKDIRTDNVKTVYPTPSKHTQTQFAEGWVGRGYNKKNINTYRLGKGAFSEVKF